MGGNPIFNFVENVGIKIASMFEKEEKRVFEDIKGADIRVVAPIDKEDVRAMYV
jgi:hypothetical protein